MHIMDNLLNMSEDERIRKAITPKDWNEIKSHSNQLLITDQEFPVLISECRGKTEKITLIRAETLQNHEYA